MHILNSTGQPSNASTPRVTRRGIVACVFAVVLAAAVYVAALHNPFIADDYRLIVENRSLLDLSNVQAIVWHDVARPVVNLSYAVDHSIWGGAPFGFHLTNLLLHALNVALFALLAWRMSEDGRRRSGPDGPFVRPHVVAPVAALLFAVHPMMTEAVGYISGRSEVLCATFFLSACLAGRRRLIGGGWLWTVASLVCWLLAAGSKEIAVMFPVVIFLYDRWLMPSDLRTLGPSNPRTFFIPLFIVAAVLAAVRLAVLASTQGGGLGLQGSLVLVELDVIRRYTTMVMLPAGQVIFHAVDPIGSLGQPRALFAIAAFAVVMAFAWWQRRRLAIASFGLVWWILLLVPSSLLVALNGGEPMAEHRVYLASCGLFLVAGLAGDRLSAWHGLRRGVTQALLAAAFLMIVIALAGRTEIRNAVWASPVLVWLEAAERAPEQWVPYLPLGEELHRVGRHDQAIVAYRRVIDRRPQEAMAYGKLGVCLTEMGDLAGAEVAFTTLRAIDGRSPEASNGLATVALLRGQPDAARVGYRETLGIDAGNIGARLGLATLEEAGGHPAEALRWCEEIRSLAPETPGNADCIRRNRASVGDAGPGR